MDYDTLQQIALNVVNTSAACDGQLFTGTVSNDNPLKIKLGEDSGSIELDGDDIILTQSVVTKKLYIKKHTHKIGSLIASHQHFVDENPFSVSGTCTEGGTVIGTAIGTVPQTDTFNGDDEIVTSTLEAWVTEYGHKLPVDPEEYNQAGEQVVITINRGLEKGDKVIMTQCSHGQQFIVLSRYFEVDKHGEDDE